MMYKCLDKDGLTHLCAPSTLNGYLVYECTECGHACHLNIEWCFNRQSEYCIKCQRPIPAFKMIKEVELTTEEAIYEAVKSAVRKSSEPWAYMADIKHSLEYNHFLKVLKNLQEQGLIEFCVSPNFVWLKE